MIDLTIRQYHNAGKLDRLLRTVIGSVFIYFGFINTGLIGQVVLTTLIGIFGIINLVVAVTGVCPVYTLAGISTCGARRAHSR
jgi:hypothetical protein